MVPVSPSGPASETYPVAAEDIPSAVPYPTAAPARASAGADSTSQLIASTQREQYQQEQFAQRQQQVAAREQEQAAREAQRQAAETERGIQHVQNDITRHDLDAQGIPHVVNSFGAVESKYTPEQWQAMQTEKAGQTEQETQAKLQGRPYVKDGNTGAILYQHSDDEWRKIQQDKQELHRVQQVEKELAAQKALFNDDLQQPGRQPLKDTERKAHEKLLADTSRQAVTALIPRLSEQAKATTGGVLGIGASPTPEASAAQQRRADLQKKLYGDKNAPVPLDESDLGLLKEVNPDLHSKLTSTQSLIEADKQNQVAHQTAKMKLSDLELKKDNYPAWLAKQTRMVAESPDPATHIAGLEAGYHEKRAALETHVRQIQQQRDLHAQTLAQIEAENQAAQAGGISGPDSLLLPGPPDENGNPGPPQAWSKQLYVKHQQAKVLADNWEKETSATVEPQIKAQQEMLGHEAQIINAAHEHAAKLEAGKRTEADSRQQQYLQANGMHTVADAVRTTNAEMLQRQADLQAKYPEGPQSSPEATAAFKAFHDDAATKQQHLDELQQQKKIAGRQLYGLLRKFQPKIDWAAQSQSPGGFALIQNKLKESGLDLTPEEAKSAIATHRALDWSMPYPGQHTFDFSGDPIVRDFAKSLWGDESNKPTDPYRLLPDGTPTINPALAASKQEWNKAVDDALAKSPLKQQAPQLREALDKQRKDIHAQTAIAALPLLSETNEYQAFLATKRKADPHFDELTPVQQVTAYVDERPARAFKGLAAVASGAVKGVVSLAHLPFAVGAAVTGSSTLNNIAQNATANNALLDQKLGALGYNDTPGLRLLDNVSNTAVQLAPTIIGGAVGQIGGRMAVALREAKDAGGFLRALGGSTSALAVKGASVGALAGSSIAAGAQTTGQIYGDAYAAAKADGKSDQEAHQLAQGPAFLSGGLTAILAMGQGLHGVASVFRPSTKPLGQLLSTETKQAIQTVLKDGISAFAKPSVKKATFEVTKLFGKSFYQEGASEALNESLDQLQQGLVARHSYEPNKSIGEILAEVVQAGALGGLMGGTVGSLHTGMEVRHEMPPSIIAPHQRPEQIAAARAAINNYTPEGATPEDVKASRQRASAVLNIAQGNFSKLTTGDLAAIGWQRENGKLSPLKDYAGPPILEFADKEQTQPIIRQEYLDLLDQHLPAVSGAIGMDEVDARQHYAQQAAPQTVQGANTQASGTAPLALAAPAQQTTGNPEAGVQQPTSPETGNPNTAATVPRSSIDPPRGYSVETAAAPANPGGVETPKGEGKAPLAEPSPADFRPVYDRLHAKEISSVDAVRAVLAKHPQATPDFIQRTFGMGPSEVRNNLDLIKGDQLDLSPSPLAGEFASGNPLEVRAQKFAELLVNSGHEPASSLAKARQYLKKAGVSGGNVSQQYAQGFKPWLAKHGHPDLLPAGLRSVVNPEGEAKAEAEAAATFAKRQADQAAATKAAGVRRVPYMESVPGYYESQEKVIHSLPLGDRKRARTAMRSFDQAMGQYGKPFRRVVLVTGQHNPVLRSRTMAVTGDILHLNLPQLVRQMSGVAHSRAAVTAQVTEELIHHVAVAQAATDEKFSHAGMRRLWNSLPENLRKLVWQAYNNAQPQNAAARLPDLTPAEQYHMSHEFLRMLIQDAKFRGQITETIDQSPRLLKWISSMLRTLGQKLREFLGKAPKSVREDVTYYEAKITKALAEVEGAFEAGRASMDENEAPARTEALTRESLRQLHLDAEDSARAIEDAHQQAQQNASPQAARALREQLDAEETAFPVTEPPNEAPQPGPAWKSAAESAAAMLDARLQHSQDNSSPRAREALREQLSAQQQVSPAQERVPDPIPQPKSAAESASAIEEEHSTIDAEAQRNTSPQAKEGLARRLAGEAHMMAQMYKAAGKEVEAAVRAGTITAAQAEQAGVMARIATGDLENRDLGFWKVAGVTLKRQLAQLGVGVSDGNLFTRPGTHAAYVERRHILLRQSALDRLGQVLPITRQLIGMSEAQARQQFGLPEEAQPQTRPEVPDPPPSLPATSDSTPPPDLAQSAAAAPAATVPVPEDGSSPDLPEPEADPEEDLADDADAYLDTLPAGDRKAHGAATSPHNDLPEPTEAQKKAGNYQMGHVKIAGLDISIENPQGSVRRGVDKDGKPWETPMHSHYGYFKGTTGSDGDHMDVFVKPGTPADYNGPVWIVNQTHADGTFDEHKVVLGSTTPPQALAEYLQNYQPGWKGAQSLARFRNPAEFKQWATGATRRAPARGHLAQPLPVTPGMTKAARQLIPAEQSGIRNPQSAIALPASPRLHDEVYYQQSKNDVYTGKPSLIKGPSIPPGHASAIYHQQIAAFEEASGAGRPGSRGPAGAGNARIGSGDRALPVVALAKFGFTGTDPSVPPTSGPLRYIGGQAEGSVYADDGQGVVYKFLHDFEGKGSHGAFPELTVTDGRLDSQLIPAPSLRHLQVRLAVQNGLGGTPTELVGVTPQGHAILKQPLSGDPELRGATQTVNQALDRMGLVQIPPGMVESPTPAYVGWFQEEPWFVSDASADNFIADTQAHPRAADLQLSPLIPQVIQGVRDLDRLIEKAQDKALELGHRDSQLFASERRTEDDTAAKPGVAGRVVDSVVNNSMVTGALNAPAVQALSKVNTNHLDTMLTTGLSKLSDIAAKNGLVQSLTAAVGNSKAAQFFQWAVDGLKKQFTPLQMWAPEALAAYRQFKIKDAWGKQLSFDIDRARTGKNRFVDLVVPQGYDRNPTLHRDLRAAMEGDKPMSEISPDLQRLAHGLRELLKEEGKEAVRVGNMSADTYAGLADKFVPAFFQQDDQNQSLFSKARLLFQKGVQAQRTTAWHIVDTEQADPTTGKKGNEGALVSWNDKGNMWRFKSEEHRDGFYRDFIKDQVWKQLKSRRDVEMRGLTREGLNNPETLTDYQRAVVREHTMEARRRWQKKAPLDLDQREKAGLIVDPLQSVLRYVATMHHDNAVAEFFNAIAANPKFTSDAPVAGFTPIPENRSYGRLSGKHVLASVADQVMQTAGTDTDALLDLYDEFMNFWKTAHTVWSSSTQVRNLIGNIPFAQFAGNSLLNPGNWGHYMDMIRILRGSDPVNGVGTANELLKEMHSLGVLGTDFTTAELKSILRGGPNPDAMSEGDKPVRFIARAARVLNEKLGRAFSAVNTGLHAAYSGTDELFKGAAYLKARKEGMTKEEAAGHIKKWFPDYSSIGTSASLKVVKRFVFPFYSFFSEATRIGLLAAKERPVTFASQMLVPLVLTRLSMAMLGLRDDRDREEVNKSLKGHLRGTDLPVFSILLPWTADGKVAQLDLTNISPFASWLSNHTDNRGDKESNWVQMLTKQLATGSPLAGIVAGLAFNEDPFNGRPIILAGMTAMEKLQAQASHVAGELAPPLTPFVGSSWHTVEQSLDRGADKTLAKRSVTQAVMRAVLGIDLRSAQPDLYRYVDEFREANNMPANVWAGGTTAQQNMRKLLYSEIVQGLDGPPNLRRIRGLLTKIEADGKPVRTQQDINRLLFSHNPVSIIEGKQNQQLLQATAPPLVAEALQEMGTNFQRIQAMAPGIIAEALALPN